MTLAEIRDKFTYHPPSSEGVTTHARLSAAFIAAAETVDESCPDSREKSLAMTKLEEAKFWSSAAVARDPSTR